MAQVGFGKKLLVVCAFFAWPPAAWASAKSPTEPNTSFAYPLSHAIAPLPDAVIERITDREGKPPDFADFDGWDLPAVKPVDVGVGPPRVMSRGGLCSAVVSVARANGLPVPFFANLIWQESSFNTKTVSRAGAQGIAQFMPKTAVEFGLINPFEPIHALNVAGKFVRELHDRFGNLGLAAAAYNAGPRRVSDWMAKRGDLPGETRNYVLRITGRPADAWASPRARTDPETTLMPAKAPCVEVVEEVKVQAQVVRVSRLMLELAGAAMEPSREDRKVQVPVAADVKTADRTLDRKGRAALMRVLAGMAEVADVASDRAAKSLGRAAEKITGKIAAVTVAKTVAKPDAKSVAKTAIAEASIKDVAKPLPPRHHVAARRMRVAYSIADRIH